jgi:hypothetical protein
VWGFSGCEGDLREDEHSLPSAAEIKMRQAVSAIYVTSLYIYIYIERERERERERQRDRERETDRERKRDRKREREQVLFSTLLYFELSNRTLHEDTFGKLMIRH